MLILEKLGFDKSEIDAILKSVEIAVGLKSITVFNKTTKSENVINISGLSKSILQSDLTTEQKKFIQGYILSSAGVQSKKDYSDEDIENTIKDGGLSTLVLPSAETIFSEVSNVSKTKKPTIQQKEECPKLKDATELYSWVEGTNTKYLYIGDIGVLKIAINPKNHGALSIRIEWDGAVTNKAKVVINHVAVKQLGFNVYNDYASVHLSMGSISFSTALGALITTISCVCGVKEINGFDFSIIREKVTYWQ